MVQIVQVPLPEPVTQVSVQVPVLLNGTSTSSQYYNPG